MDAVNAGAKIRLDNPIDAVQITALPNRRYRLLESIPPAEFLQRRRRRESDQ